MGRKPIPMMKVSEHKTEIEAAFQINEKARKETKELSETLEKFREFHSGAIRDLEKRLNQKDKVISSFVQDLKHAQRAILTLGSELEIIRDQDLNKGMSSYNTYGMIDGENFKFKGAGFLTDEYLPKR